MSGNKGVDKIWKQSHNGKIKYISLTARYLEQSLDVLRKSFFVDEKVSIAVELYKNDAAKNELEELCLRAAEDGLSIIALDTSIDKVVGVAFNKLQIATSDDEEPYFSKFAKACKEENSKALVKFMLDVDVECDLFNVCKVDCMLEIMFIAVLREYRGSHIGVNLFEVSINLAKMLKSGENCKVPLNDEVLTAEPIPKAVCAIFTSNVTQNIGKKFHFCTAKKISYDKFVFNGKKFSERIGSETPFTTVEYLTI